MNYISISGYELSIINVNDYDVWSINVIDANFMLNRYNGRGKTTITITPFPNMGDGLFGYVQFSINNNPCFSGSLSNINGDGKSFNIYPKYVTLNGKDDTAFVNVDSSCEYEITNGTSEFSTSKGTNGFTITSTSNDSFENLEVIVKNCDGLTEIVYVSQKETQVVNNMLNVNPQYISLSNDDKTFTINVTSVCNGNNTFTHNTLEGVNLTINGNKINGTITSDTFTSGSFTISNDCNLSKTVNIIYSKEEISSCLLYIDGAKEVKYIFNADTTTSYTIESSSNWSIYSYDSNRVRCSKSGNILYISLGEDKSESSSKEIILKNREGCEARVIYSIGSGLVSESGVTFTFEDGTSAMTSSITQTSIDEHIIVDICVFAYDNDNNAIEWKVKSSSFVADTTDLKGGTSDECKSVKLTSTDTTRKARTTNYTIKLQEQETYKELVIKVNVTRPEEEVSSSYGIEIYPETSLHSKSEMNGFQISVTPTYIYNGNTYYIGDNNVMNSVTNYKGVSAKTESNTDGVSLTLTNSDDVYDTLVYDVNIDSTTLETLESFEICTTATTKSVTKEDATVCTTISLTATTVEKECYFTTGSTSVEVGGESQTIEEVFYSQIDGEKVDIDVNSKPDWVESVTLDEYGERLYIKVTENDSFDERTGDIKITQNGGECEGEYTISIKQYNNKTIFIPDFDYLVIRYIWTAEDGDDLDTVTVVSSLIKEDGSTIEESELYSSFLGEELGWSHSSSVIDANNNVLLDFAGDNTDSGTECVYINFKNICSEEQLKLMVRDRVNKIHVDLYGNWFDSRIAGNLDVELVAYKGGTMSEPINFNFINEGGEEVYNSIESTRVCVQGQGAENAAAYETTYTKIGYVEYNITNGNAMLSLNAPECDGASYVLMNVMPSTSLTITYAESSTNYIEFISSKEHEFFNNVTLSSSQTWLSNFTTNSTSNPMRYYYNVTENTRETERLCKITVIQGESNNVIEYQIKQLANSASYFSFDYDEYVSDMPINLDENQTEFSVDIYSCINYNEENKTGNRIEYTNNPSCGSGGTITESDSYKYTQKFNVPTDCGFGTIVLIQNDTSNQLTISFSRECFCSTPQTVNATVTLSVKTQANGKKLYENNGSYFIDVICDVVLDKIITCGSATATIYYGLGSIDNAGFSEVIIPNGSSSGTSTIACSCGIVDEYDENKPMDCISSARTGHYLTFTDNDCFIGGSITATVKADSLCQPCTCDVSSVSVTPNSYKYTYDGEEKIFTLKVETDTCESCTKGYKLYDPNGNLVTAGTGENTVTITYATAVKGDYILKADDDTSKTAKLTIDKFGAYYVFCIRQTEEYVSCYSSTTITYSAADPSESYNIIIRSRYYTSDTEYTQINFTRSVDVDWITLNNDGSWKLSANNTYNERQGIITYTQETTNNKVYLYIKQSGKDTSWELTASGTTIEPEDVEAYVYVKSLKNEQPYSAIMFSERCDWVTGYYLQSSSNGIYTYQFTTLANLTTSARTCAVTAQQEGGLTGVTFDILQKAAEIITPPEEPCMTIYYTVLAGVSSCDIYFSTTNGTQQGSHSNVSVNGSKDLCNIAEGTDIKVTCSCADVILGGDTSFVYKSGTSANITLSVEEVPIITGLKIGNNEPGEAKVETYVNNTIVSTSALTKSQSGQTIGSVFSGETKINIEYESGTWANGNAGGTGWVAVEFTGSNLEYVNDYGNGILIREQGESNYFWVLGGSDSSCSGSIITKNGSYQVTINFIFKGYPYSN